MDEENKRFQDLWQKSNILLKDTNIPENDKLNLRRLKFCLIDQTFINDQSLIEPYNDLYNETFDEYSTEFTKYIDKYSPYLVNNLKHLNLHIDHSLFPKNIQNKKHELEFRNEDTEDFSENNKSKIISKNENDENKFKDFKTASNTKIESYKRKYDCPINKPNTVRKNLGGRSRFISPLAVNNEFEDKPDETCTNEDIPDIKGVDKKLVELILNDVIDKGTPITWNDIAGLEFAKNTIKEIIIWPMVRPDLFTGLLIPVKGLLLFGPPGTGKTLIGKCIANECNAKFFSISASSLTSKWFGEGEKLVRALFEVAKFFQPSVVFMDEVDSLLTARKDGEHESTRRIKTEFLVQLDGCGSSMDDRILIIGATNRPQELDDAARRRFVKRLYVSLPDESARKQIINNLIKKQANILDDEDIQKIVKKTSGYSGADMMNLCKEAALGPIRDIKDISNANKNDVRPICIQDFWKAIKNIKPSVGPDDIYSYIKWNELYGSCADTEEDSLNKSSL